MVLLDDRLDVELHIALRLELMTMTHYAYLIEPMVGKFEISLNFLVLLFILCYSSNYAKTLAINAQAGSLDSFSIIACFMTR